MLEPDRRGNPISQSIFYFMSVHIEVILYKKQKAKHIIIIYTNFTTGLWTIDLTIIISNNIIVIQNISYIVVSI